MMFVSTLLIDEGENPDRPRPGRHWLRNLYRVHQRLCMAFPSKEKVAADGAMLAPYHPKDFAISRGQVHVKREEQAGFLFRIDPAGPGRAMILVQSGLEPNWEYAFGLKPGSVDCRGRRIGNAGYLLAAPPGKPCPLRLEVRRGTQLRFRLVGNPVRKVSAKSVDREGRLLDGKWLGKHVPVPATEESLRDWLDRRAEPRWNDFKHPPQEERPGFRIVKVANISTGFIYMTPRCKRQRDWDEGRWSPQDRDMCEGCPECERREGITKCDRGRRLRTARYDGVLEVTEPQSFLRKLAAGIGPAKAFGCGLLSVAPVRA